MLVFRSLTTGLLGACLLLLIGLGDQIQRDPVTVVQMQSPAAPLPPIETTTSNVTVIDVAPGVPAKTIATLVRLHEGERIAMINDHAIENDLEAGMQIGEQLRRGSKFVDLTVTDAGTLRRVLVVLH